MFLSAQLSPAGAPSSYRTHTAGLSLTSASSRIVPAFETTQSPCWRRVASCYRSVKLGSCTATRSRESAAEKRSRQSRSRGCGRKSREKRVFAAVVSPPDEPLDEACLERRIRRRIAHDEHDRACRVEAENAQEA